MSLEKEEVDLLKKKRSTFRRNTTKLVNKVLDLRNAEEDNDTVLLKSYSEQLKTQRDELKDLDNKILGYALENEDDDACDKEVEDSSEYSGKITQALVFIKEALGGDDDAASIKSSGSRRMQRSASKESIASDCSQYSNHSDTGKRKVRVKLPQLEIKKFSGKIQDFQEFWDSFVSAIHENDELADVDKMKYLKGYLEEPARTVIAGVPVTDSNYQTAVDLLKKRFAKPSMLEHAHINQMVNIQPVFNEDDVTRLRKFRDQIETNFRGLEALSVDQGTYSKIVVPVLVEKLPKQLKFSMVRSRRKSVLEWSLDELIAELDLELEVRENHADLLRISGGRPKQEETKQQTRSKGPNTASALFTPEGKQKCVYCTEEHKSSECTIHTDPEDRKGILKKYARCFVCLKANHRSFECRSRLRCSQCKAKHHVSICSSVPLKPENKDAPSSAPGSKLSPIAPAWVGSMCSGDSVALQTALANVNDKKDCNVRVLFDSGSHRSFISAKAVENLGLRPVRRENLSIKAFGCRETDDSVRDVVEFYLVPLRGEKKVKVSCFVVDDITSIANIHVEEVKKLYPHLHMIYFSDVSRLEDKLSIQILIGSDFQWEFMEGEEIRGGPHEPVAVKTTLGWVLSGPLRGEKFDSSPECSVNFLPCEPSAAKLIDEQVNKLWDLDSLGIRPNDDVHEALIDDIVFTGERYSVSLPWKAGCGPLPLNYNNCVARLKSQVRKLKQDPKILCEYDRIISEQLETGIISRVTEMEDPEKVSYLPHSAVVRENAETTKVRVVYDASCKDKNTGTSLNDCLHVGPSLTPLIFDILLRFRDARVALVGDIAKAFLNIEVNPADRDCLRFLWLDDINAEEPEIIVLKFNSVVFGVTSSPFILNAVLRHHLSSFQDSDPDFVAQMSQSFYVDDLVTGSPNATEAYSLFCKARERMMKGGFSLRKWKTNDAELREQILQKEKGSESVDSQEEQSFAKESLGPLQETGGKTKVLGIIWDNEKDMLQFDLTKMATNSQVERPTKRGILSTLAMSFDPLGLTSPIGVQAKILFQELCKEKLEWDDPIPENKVGEWEEWIHGLNEVKTLTIPRCVHDETEGELLSCQLHGFGDASKKAYCAAVYLVCETTKGRYTKLLCSKTRVAPLKDLTIPRLELMSARILAVLMDNVYKALCSQVTFDKVKYWLDSKTALYWIYNQGEWKQWVQFRVSEILRLTKKSDWGHVGGKDNPADIGSRGVSALVLKDSKMWWEGPEWLRENEENWPKTLVLEDSKEIKEERKKMCVLSVVTEKSEKLSNVMDVERFNSLNKLLRVTAWVRRFVNNLKLKKEKRELKKGSLEVEEIKEAEKMWIQDAQKMLKESANFEKTRVHLGIIEKNGLLVCQGRLENSDLDLESKYPVILPKEHKLAQLIVLDCHEKVHHLKVRATLAELRSRFWIPRGRQFVKKILKPCFRCRYLEGKSFNAPATAALPDFRVTEAPPFSTTGVDFAGPLFVKAKNGEMVKSYICLFSCFITRAVHLELVSDLATSTFVNCLRRFCARRGTPVRIVSDNAKTFKATSKLLHELLTATEVANFLVSKRITWRFNLDRSPWWGGAFERMVGSVKRCLRKVLGNARLTQDELSTVLTEVEATLNSRPLTYQHEEFDSQVLTPSHLLVGRRISPLSNDFNNDDLDFEEENNFSLSKRFAYLTKKLSHFWKRWHTEYLSGLREEHKLKQAEPNTICKGDIVIVQDENNPKRNTWKIAIVEQLVKGKDGETRGAKVRKASRKGKPEILNRPLQKLYPLEIHCSDVCEEGKDREKSQKEMVRVNEVKNENENTGRARLRRAAAQDARWKSQLMLDP